MFFIGDFHLHSKYSRATSKEMNLENLWKWGQYKGIKVLSAADFTHPLWFAELEEKLSIEAGYDGEYGTVHIFSGEERERTSKKQEALF